MALYNKNKAGYIGFYRFNSPFACSGVWNLQQHHTEVIEKEWIDQTFYQNTGDLTGWTNNGATISSGAISVNGTNYCYINPDTSRTSLLYTTIEFDVYVTGGVLAVFFGHSQTGRGPLIKLDTRVAKYSGLMFANAWGSYSAEPIAGPQLLPNTWTKVQLCTNNSMRNSWYINNLFRDVQPVLFNGPYIGIHGFGGGGLVDNIKVYNGIL